MLDLLNNILRSTKTLFGKNIVEPIEVIDNNNSINNINILPTEEEKIDIIIDKKIRTKYKEGWINKIRKQPIKEIVLHGTGGGNTIEGFLRWMFDGERANEYFKGTALIHYVIGKEGEIVEIIDPEYYTFHSSSGFNDMKTICIELINSSKSNRDPYTKKQYIALEKLIFKHLIKLYPTITRITSHRFNILTYNTPKVIQQKLKQCPGEGFDWNKLDEMLKENKYNYQVSGNLRYNISKIV
jgi:hypothetical protein